MGFLTDAVLAKEGTDYGEAGSHPQVVWPNGVLASTAVGLAVDLVTGWAGQWRTHEYLTYDGNESTLIRSPLLRKMNGKICPHFLATDVGDPVVTEL
jgi:hypothetical protein